jgi:two-component system sensor histidine kinase QseC
MADLTPEALRRHQTLELEAPDFLQINGQNTLWHILLRNLVDNALRYTPDGAIVRIHAHSLAHGGVEVTVQDSGPGMSPQDRARLGERFFRVLGTSAPGSGLGWSIIGHIASLQHIKVEVDRSQDLGGLLVRLRCEQARA